jgi:hypothetical protein
MLQKRKAKFNPHMAACDFTGYFISLVLCDLHVSILYLPALPSPPPSCQNTSLFVSFLVSPFLLHYHFQKALPLGIMFLCEFWREHKCSNYNTWGPYLAWRMTFKSPSYHPSSPHYSFHKNGLLHWPLYWILIPQLWLRSSLDLCTWFWQVSLPVFLPTQAHAFTLRFSFSAWQCLFSPFSSPARTPHLSVVLIHSLRYLTHPSQPRKWLLNSRHSLNMSYICKRHLVLGTA